MRRRRWLASAPAVLAAPLAASLALGGCAAPPRRLAFIGGLTGRTADLGVGGRDAVQLALEQAGHGGGAWSLDAFDDRQDPQQAVAALRAAHAAGHALVVGPMTSAMAVALVPLAAELDVVLLAPTVTTTDLSGRDDALFRVVSAVDQYARVSAEHHAGRAGLRRFAIVRDDGNRAYTAAWSRAFTNELQRWQATVADEQAYVFSPTLAMPELARRALQSRPDAVLIVSNAVDAARLAQALRKLAPTLPLITSEWAATEEFLSLGGGAVEGVTVTQFLDRDSRAPAYLAFVEAFRARFGRTPGFAETAAHDAARIAMHALQARADGEPLRQTLHRLRRFDGLQQPVEFDVHGDAVRAVFVTRVQGGRFVAMR